jgi:CRP-like cAMP-binding protein
VSVSTRSRPASPVATKPTASDLEHIPLFASLSESEREELAESFEVKSAVAETQLIDERTGGYSFFALADGQVRVTTNDNEIATLGPGDCFGEMALLGSGRRTASVTTTTPTTVYVMYGTEFRRLEQTHPEVVAQIKALMRERLMRQA